MKSWPTYKRRDQTKPQGCEDVETCRQLLNDLDNLLAQSRRFLATGRINYSASQAMAGHVAEARALLAELSGEHGKGVGDKVLAERFALLKEHFFELEGMVKELRNGFESAGKQE